MEGGCLEQRFEVNIGKTKVMVNSSITQDGLSKSLPMWGKQLKHKG